MQSGDVLVALEQAGGGWDAGLSAAGDEPSALPAIVLAELLVGVRMATGRPRAEARRSKIEALVARVPVVEFGAEVAAFWATLFAALSRKGRLIPANDLAVAATALHLGLRRARGT